MPFSNYDAKTRSPDDERARLGDLDEPEIEDDEPETEEDDMKPPDEPTGRYFAAPDPPTACEREGSQWARQLARRYLPQTVRLAAAIGLGDSDASTWTRLQAARLIAQIAGATPESTPEASQPDDEGRRSRLAP